MRRVDIGQAANLDKQRAHIELIRRRPGSHTEVGSPRDPQRILIRFGDAIEQWERIAQGFYQLEEP